MKKLRLNKTALVIWLSLALTTIVSAGIYTSSAAGAVSSVFGRVGAVVAQASDYAELLGVADLSDFSGKSGTGTTALGATITSPTTNDVLTWNGTNWINQAATGTPAGTTGQIQYNNGGAFGGSILTQSANTIEQLNSTNAQTFKVDNTNDGAGNSEWGGFQWNTNVFRVTTSQTGTGANRDMVFRLGGSDRWTIKNNSGSFLATTDGGPDIGAAGATRPDHVYVKSYIQTPVRVSAKTTAYTVLSSDSNTTFTNAGATGAVNFTLPTAVAGYTFTFIVEASQTVTITAATGATIRLGASVSATAGTASSSTIGNVITITATSATTWVVTSHEGTWTIA